LIQILDDAPGNPQSISLSGSATDFTFPADYGYAVTSHSSQGQTVDRVLIHVDTEQAGEKLVNRRLAYVAVSQGRYDAQIYTNDKGHLAEQLSRDVSHRSAIEASRESASLAGKIEPSPAQSQVQEHTQGESTCISISS
jgi:hypothetical protein